MSVTILVLDISSSSFTAVASASTSASFSLGFVFVGFRNSGDWVVVNEADHLGVDVDIPSEAYDWLSGKVRWDAEQIRRGSRL